jgi:hypothetical protein
LAKAGVDPLEAESWDEFILSWCQDYLHNPSILPNDNIHLAIKDRESPPPNPEGYRILECDGRKGRQVRVLSSLIMLATEAEQEVMHPIASGAPRYFEGFDDAWDTDDKD